MTLITRKRLAMAFDVLLAGIAMAATALRVRLALEDPHMAFAWKLSASRTGCRG